MQKSGDAVRVNVQLINALNDAHLWGDVYERKLTDIFAVESDIAKTIADTLQAKLTGVEKQLISSQPTSDTHGLRALSQRPFALEQTWRRKSAEAIAFYEQAIAAIRITRSLTADWRRLMLSCQSTLRWRNGRPIESEGAALKALQLDEKLAEAHTALGLLLCSATSIWLVQYRNFSGHRAKTELRDRAPMVGNGPLLALGRFDEAIAEGKRAIELDPLSPIINADLGQNLTMRVDTMRRSRSCARRWRLIRRFITHRQSGHRSPAKGRRAGRDY